MTNADLDSAELLRREQERAAQLETYAADLRRTYAELRRHLQHMTVLHELSTRIVSALDPDEVIAGMLDSLNDLLTYQSASIYLVELDTTARWRAGRDADGRALSDLEGSVAARESTVAEATREGHTVGRMATSGALQLAIPLLAGGRALGALEVYLGSPLGVDDVKVVELLAATAAVALHNARLYQETQRLATTDSLTGLSNYRHFHELLSLEVQRARRMDYPVGFLVMDLDHFKTINDCHGHPAGDRTLQLVAEQLRKRLRRTDVVGRIGGEEFAVILPGDSLDEVSVVAEKVRRAVEELPPVEGGMASSPSRVTLSVGGTSLDSRIVDEKLLMSCADRALYDAKRNGRNQVRLWTDPDEIVSTSQWTA